MNTRSPAFTRGLVALNVIALSVAILTALVVTRQDPPATRPAPAQASGSATPALPPSPPPPPAGATRELVRLTHSGLERGYILYVPASVNAQRTTPAPLMLMLHGRSQTAAAAEVYTGFSELAEAAGVILVYPGGYGGSWNAGTCCALAREEEVDDVGFLAEVISRVGGSYPVDRTRVYMAGFSNGGMMSYRYACERASELTAIVVASGALATTTPCTPSQPVALLQLHGGLDTTVPFEGVQVSDDGQPRRSVVSSSEEFARSVGCTLTRTEVTLSPLLQRSSYVGCPAGGEVSFYRSSTLGHRWARDDAVFGLDYTDLSWEFLLARRR